METDVITALSKEALREVHAQPDRKAKFVVQFMGAVSKAVKDKTIYVARISDGTFTAGFVVYPQISEQLVAVLRPYDVIEAGLTKRDANSTYTIIYEFRLIYTGLEAAIGRPVEFAPGAENPLGEEAIPERALAANRAQRPAAAPAEEGERPRRDPVRRLASEAEAHYTPLGSLNLYDRSWTVRGRVVKKSELKRFKAGGREGCVFSVVVRDEEGAIQASFFGEAAERFHPFLSEGAVYAFSDGEVKSAGRFNTTDHKQELTFGERAVIREVADAQGIGNFHFKFATIDELRTKSETEIFDLIAIVEDPGAVREVALRDGTLREKRTLGLLDHTGFKIEATLWGQMARESCFEPESVVVLQDMRVKDYNGSKSLSSSMGTKVLARVPDCPQLTELLLFRNARGGAGDNFRSLSEHGSSGRQRVTKLAQLLQEVEALLAEPDQARLYFTAICHPVRAVNSLYYDSCPNDACMKKLTQSTFNNYFCEKCHKTYEQARPRFMAALKVVDDSGALVATFCGEEYCQALFGCPAARLRELREHDEGGYNEFVRDHLYGEYSVRLLAKREFFNGEARMKFQAVRLTPIAKSFDFACGAFALLLAE